MVPTMIIVSVRRLALRTAIRSKAGVWHDTQLQGAQCMMAEMWERKWNQLWTGEDQVGPFIFPGQGNFQNRLDMAISAVYLGTLHSPVYVSQRGRRMQLDVIVPSQSSSCTPHTCIQHLLRSSTTAWSRLGKQHALSPHPRLNELDEGCYPSELLVFHKPLPSMHSSASLIGSSRLMCPVLRCAP